MPDKCPLTVVSKPATIWRQLPWPSLVIGLAIIVMALLGPIEQLADYHRFADQRSYWGIPRAADVLSNMGFAVVGGWGLLLLWRRRDASTLQAGRAGYVLFFVALILTALGSAYYHLAPDNARLVWDRLPIALACAGLLAAIWNETRPSSALLPYALALAAICSVLWWRFTDLHGAGDLRPYLLVQCLPLLLIPLLQWQHGHPLRERRLVGLAMLLYIAAKLFELLDWRLFEVLGALSGHTLKHLFACLAAAVVLGCLARRETVSS